MPENHDELDGFDKRSGSNEHASFDLQGGLNERAGSNEHADFDVQGGHVVTVAVTRATTITGKVTSIGGIKVGDLVSASISGTNGKLIADSIQDPASLPSGPGQ